MAWKSRPAGVLLGLALLAASLAGGRAALTATPAAGGLPPPPQWVGGVEERGKARLIWIRSPAFASVRVYRRDAGPAAPFAALGSTEENAWLDDTVQPGKSYRYRLAGVGKDGREGPPSSELEVRIGAAVIRAPAVPVWEGFTVLERGVGLKWASQEGQDVVVWNVYRRTPPETVYRLLGSTRGTNYVDTGLEFEKPYVYVLTALDSSFRETPYSSELAVTLPRPKPVAEKPLERAAWRMRRTRLVAVVTGAKDLAFERPADIAVGPVTGNVYVADSGRNLVFVFSRLGQFQHTMGGERDGLAFRNILGLAVDRSENLYVVDAGASAIQVFTPEGRRGARLELPPPAGGANGFIDVAARGDGRLYVVDNFNGQVTILDAGQPPVIVGRPGGKPGEFSAPTFCDLDGGGSLFVADCYNGRVQVFTAGGEFVRSFGRPERGPGGFGRPKGVAVGAFGEVYVADSWLNTVQVFDAEGRFSALLADEQGAPLDLGSPNGVALGRDRRVYIAERLAARVQIRELVDAP